MKFIYILSKKFLSRCIDYSLVLLWTRHHLLCGTPLNVLSVQYKITMKISHTHFCTKFLFPRNKKNSENVIIFVSWWCNSGSVTQTHLYFYGFGHIYQSSFDRDLPEIWNRICLMYSSFSKYLLCASFVRPFALWWLWQILCQCFSCSGYCVKVC